VPVKLEICVFQNNLEPATDVAGGVFVAGGECEVSEVSNFAKGD
jgi:hypothetical protein